MKQFLSVVETDRIAALQEPVLRNLLITQCYFELSSAVARRTGARANWCTFATWASKQAGQTIRGEDLARALEHALAQEPSVQEMAGLLVEAAKRSGVRHGESEIRQLIREAIDPRAAMERAGEAVARGNQKVFAEIGHEFARFAGGCLKDAAFDAQHIGDFCARLRPGPPPDGQQYLQQAFSVYYRALFETDARNRAESMLLANLLIGFHEQTRLQPEIAAALNASVPDPYLFARRLIGALFPYRGWIIYSAWWILRKLGRPSGLDTAINRYFDGVRLRIRSFLTDHLMELSLPQRRLKLGRDLTAGVPEILRHPDNPDLLALLQQVDLSPDSLQDSGARDWADLPDRMHFIADLFRCYQEAPEMLKAPFSAEQVDALEAGNVPAGPL